MNTEVVTWIMFFISAIQYFYIIDLFFERTIKNFWIGALIHTFVELSLRKVASMVEGNAYWIPTAGVLIVQLLILLLLFRYKKWWHVCLGGCGVMMTMIVLQFPILWFVELFTGTNVVGDVNGGDFNLTYVVVSTLDCMINMIFIVIIYVIKLRIRYKSSRMMLVSTFMVVVYQMLVILFFYGLCWKNGDSAVYGGVIFVAISILTDMVILNRIEDVLKKIQLEKEWNKLTLQRKSEYQYYYKVQEEIEKMRMERHDYMNYIQTIERMISDPSQYGEAQKLIDELRENYKYKEAKE